MLNTNGPILLVKTCITNFFAVKKTSEFYMTSYLAYLLDVKFPYKGLDCVRTLGMKKGKNRVYDCYP